MPQESFARASRAIGAMFLSLFGGAWLTLWCAQAYGPQPVILILIAAGSLTIFSLALRQLLADRQTHAARRDDSRKKRALRYFGIVNVVQWFLIFCAVIVLAKSGKPQWICAAIIIIVGVHFLPLAAIFRYRPHYVTGSSLILLAITYPIAVGPASSTGPFAAGVILWISAIAALTANNSFKPRSLRGRGVVR